MISLMFMILGIESTAHTFGVAVCDMDGKILTNVKDSYSTEEGGMIPIDVREHHEKVAPELYERALNEAKISEDKIVAIAFSNAPGISLCLLEGMKFSKKLSERLNVPIVCVNHCIAHLEIGEITGAKDPVLLYASGANTQIIAYEAGRYRIFGETLDTGVGNFIDTFARYAGIGFPGGPKIQKLAESSEKKLIDLPYSIKGMDVAFSGILTKLRRMLEKKEYSVEDLSYSLQETVFAMLVESAERALAHTGKTELLLGGGVACNSRLREMCQKMCEERGAKYFCPDFQFLVDNAGMIAYSGLKMYNAGLFEKNLDKIDIAPRERTDDVDVIWR